MVLGHHGHLGLNANVYKKELLLVLSQGRGLVLNPDMEVKIAKEFLIKHLIVPEKIVWVN
jgi:hypothetical protein